MRLKELLEGVDIEYSGSGNRLKNIEVDDIVYDSRNARRNTIFVAIKGESVDGHSYCKSAYDKGCRIFLIEKDVELPDDSIKVFQKDSRRSLSRMSANLFGHPSRELKLIGVTGTKGKTTITQYLKQVLDSAGLNTGVIGTNGTFYNGKEEKTINTTPESYELHKLFRRMHDEGVECVAIEASSSGMMMHRVDDIDFDVVIFNNISPDHIGPKEHPTFEDYLECKAMLFKYSDYGLVNMDDEKASFIKEYAPNCHIDGFAINTDCEFKAEDIVFHRDIDELGVDFVLKGEDSDKGRFYLPCPGEFSVYNALAVIATCRRLGIYDEKIKAGLKTVRVPGRVEVLPIVPDISVILDYAHNGVSLENVLGTLKEYPHKRLICLFGSIGSRAAIRRKELGDVAARECDIAILTTDNPDDEDPMKIINEIAESFVDSSCEVIKEVDREKAIYMAVDIAQPGDMVVIAGKGHEKYQIINGERVFFDEKGIAEAACHAKLKKIQG